MFQNILLPVDINHPESWQKALPLALKSAGSSGTVHVLGIVHDLGSALIASYLPSGFEKDAMERLKAELIAFAGREIPAGTASQVHVGHGHVAETILRTATHIGADAIFMASHPPHDLQTILVGSQADKVVRHAEIPVLVVR